MSKYAVVEFCGPDREVAVIAKVWLFSDNEKLKTYWPPAKSSTIVGRFIERCVPVDQTTWMSYDCKVLYSTDDYAKARQKAKDAEEQTNLESEMETVASRRVRKKRHSHFEDSLESSDSCHETTVLAHRRSHNGTPKKSVKVHEKPPPPVPPAVPSSLFQHPIVGVCQPPQASLLSAPPSLAESRSPALSSATSADLLQYPSSSGRRHLTSHSTTPLTASMVSVPSSSASADQLQRSSRLKHPDLSSPSLAPPAVSNVPDHCVLRTSSTPKRPSGGAVSAVERQLLVKIIELQESVKELQKTQALFMVKLDSLLMTNGSSGSFEEVPEDIHLPIKAISELHDFNKKMESRGTKFNVAKVLSRTGGSTVDECTRRILRDVMTNSFARNFNWAGRNGKLAFKKTVLCPLITRAVRLNPSTADAPNKRIESVIKDWLKFAKQRDGGRKEREQRKKQDRLSARDSTSQYSDRRLESQDSDNE